jgi:hypothetical protein
MMMHKNYPDFPMLEPEQLHVPLSVLAEEANCTRQSIHRWRKGNYKAMRPVFLMGLNEVAYRLLRAAKANRLPVRKAGGISTSPEAWRAALDDKNYPNKLSEMTPLQVFPKAWWPALGLISEQENADS